MHEPADAVITGLIRDNVEFSLILSKVLLWRDNGLLNNVVFSTWSGHLDEFPGLRKALEERGVQIVETVTPKIGGMGNVFFQKTSLARGLAHLDGNRMVLKLRTDIIAQYIIRSPELEDLLQRETQEKIEDKFDIPNVLDDKLIILDCGGNGFFYMMDTIFYGRRRDLERLCVMDSAYDAYCLGDTIAAEQRWFADPFIRELPAFRELFMHFDISQISAKISHYIEKFNSNESHECLEMPEYFVKITAMYYMITRLYFGTFKNPKASYIHLIGMDPVSLPSLGLYPFSLATGEVNGLDAFQVFDGIWNGDAFGCPFRARFVEAVDWIRRGGWRNLSILDEDVDALIEFDRHLLPERSIFWQLDLLRSNLKSRMLAQTMKAHWRSVGESPGIPMSLYPMEGQQEIELVRRLLFSGAPYPQACADLFEVYAKGLDVKKDAQKAKFWISRAAKTNPYLFLFPYGIFLFEEAKSTIEQENALEKIGLVAYRNIQEAAAKLVEIAKASPFLRATALQKLKEAAGQANAAHAQLALATWLLEEDRSPAAQAQAVEWLKRAGNGGSAEANALLQTLSGVPVVKAERPCVDVTR